MSVEREGSFHILRSESEFCNPSNEFYSGRTFMQSGEVFPVLCDEEQAKRYYSLKVAGNVCKTLFNKTGQTFKPHFVYKVIER